MANSGTQNADLEDLIQEAYSPSDPIAVVSELRKQWALREVHADGSWPTALIDVLQLANEIGYAEDCTLGEDQCCRAIDACKQLQGSLEAMRRRTAMQQREPVQGPAPSGMPLYLGLVQATAGVGTVLIWYLI